MVILQTGAIGFIGRPVADSLERAGHEVIRAARRETMSGRMSGSYLAVDYTRDFAESHWAPRLVGVDAVINAAGFSVSARGRPSRRFTSKRNRLRTPPIRLNAGERRIT